MSEWQFVRLGEVCTKITDGTHHSPLNGSSGDFKYITAKNIKPWGLDLTNVTYVDQKTHREIFSRCDVRKGDVLYVKDGATTGRVALNPLEEEFSLLSSVGVLRPGPAVRAKYLLYALQEPQTREKMLADVAGVAITRLTLRKLNDALIPLAPLACQDRIVEKIEELLSDLDAGVAELKVAQRKLIQYRQSLLKAAVEGELTAGWRAEREKRGGIAETGEQLLERILAERRRRWEEKQLAKFNEQGKKPPKGWKEKYPEPVEPDTANLPELPEGWVWASIQQLASDAPYSLAIGPFGSNLKVSDYSDQGVPLIFVRNIRSKNYGGNFTKFVSVSKALELRSHSVEAGDVLITKMGEPPGDADVYPADQPPAIITADCIKVRANDDLIKPHFLAAAINSLVGKLQVLPITQGVAQKKVSLGRFSTIAVPIPSLDEQEEIVERLQSACCQSECVDKELISLGQMCIAQRKNILKAAFSGQLVPQDPNDEPASVLLERIRVERATQKLKRKPKTPPPLGEGARRAGEGAATKKKSRL
ncbi:restriction endonuclease subunit S [Geomonas paludis]|uniref:Restriction endonuclease subunit S n=1 Tax=Geomonas paludis TaxID=2740185 RepID=A0A6V8MQY6_9BACT|nr:restriction endonuclease subunit S [Geomonas paludis]UPU35912.1 restriction endonuclease subunit S [Geomonas paludis]GFO62505.1 restriction endonuclease type I, S subunit [Geomonas paludis]